MNFPVIVKSCVTKELVSKSTGKPFTCNFVSVLTESFDRLNIMCFESFEVGTSAMLVLYGDNFDNPKFRLEKLSNT